MLDFNVLFNKVFKPTDSSFDPNANYYTVFVNCATEADYYAEFDSQRKMYIGDSYYREMSVDGTLSVDEFRTNVMSLGQEFAVKINNAFIFLMDFVNKEYDSAFAKEYLQTVRDYKQPNDTVAVIAVLPNDMEKTASLLESLEKDINENEVLYLYNKQPYREKLLSEGICGIALLHSSKFLYNDFRRKEQSHLQTLNSALAGLPAEGAAAIKAKKQILWSSMGCSFSNPKMEYLKSYIAVMCNKATKLNNDNYANICGELYSGMAEDTNKAATQALLIEAVESIPKITKDIPKYDGYTLKDYFAQLYGGDGYKNVELSFKVTLAMMPNALNESVVVNVANSLFERASKYHSPDLFSEICGFLSEYRESFNRQFSSTRNSMVAFVNQHAENDSFDEDLRTYTENYIKNYELQKRSDFWDSVESFVRNHKHLFESYCRKSQKLNDDLVQLKRELLYRKEVNVDSDGVRSYPVCDIFEAYTNPEICNDIAAMYKEPENRVNDSGDVEMDYLIKLSSPPGFSTAVRYEIVTGNGGYTAYLQQNIGKYLHFIKNGRV